MTLVLIYFQRALLLTHSHLMPQKYVRLWFIIQLKMPLFLYRVQAWYLLAVKNCKKLFVCKSSSLLEPLSLQQFRAIFNFAIYMMDGEVRIRKYFNDFQHNHHDYSHKWMRHRATLFFDWNWKENWFENKFWHSQVAENFQFPAKVCCSYSNKVEWFNTYFTTI